MNKHRLFFILLSVLAGLNLGTVRRTEDPIRDTQTNPILYEQKKEEEKDGKKGPLLYHVRNNPKESFFIDPPYEAEKETAASDAVNEKIPATTDTAGWWEEQPAGPGTGSFVESVPADRSAAETFPESLPGEEKARDLGAAEQSAASPEAESAPSGKSDDYWW